MSLALSICVFVYFNYAISKRSTAQFLNTTSLPKFPGSAGAGTRAIDIVPIASIYASL